MKVTFLLFLFALTLSISVNAQMTPAAKSSPAPASADAKPKRQIFRANKDQIKQVQTMLKAKGKYTGEAMGKLDDATRLAIKDFQKDHNLKETGTLNRATLEKMGIELTVAQKAIPVSQNPAAGASAAKTTSGDKPKNTIFRATKEQITAAQKLLKSKSIYSGIETGKLDDATRDALKKYQTESGLKATGTLNAVTLDKMGISLTDKQKANTTVGQK